MKIKLNGQHALKSLLNRFDWKRIETVVTNPEITFFEKPPLKKAGTSRRIVLVITADID
jgi:hypothetical protein